MRHNESAIQRVCVQWFRLQYPKLAMLLFAVPNGGARSRTEAAIMKGEGVTAGVSDLLLLYPSNGYHGLCIEMKDENGRQRPTQKAWQQAVEQFDYKYVICHSFDEFATAIMDYFNRNVQKLLKGAL